MRQPRKGIGMAAALLAGGIWAAPVSAAARPAAGGAEGQAPSYVESGRGKALMAVASTPLFSPYARYKHKHPPPPDRPRPLVVKPPMPPPPDDRFPIDAPPQLQETPEPATL